MQYLPLIDCHRALGTGVARTLRMLRLREVVGSNPTVSIEEFHRFFDVPGQLSDEKGEEEGAADVLTPVANTFTSNSDCAMAVRDLRGASCWQGSEVRNSEIGGLGCTTSY